MECPNPELQQPENPNGEHEGFFAFEDRARSAEALDAAVDRRSEQIC